MNQKNNNNTQFYIKRGIILNKQEALNIIYEYYHAPQNKLEDVYNLAIDLYENVTYYNLINAIIKYHQQRIELNKKLLNIINTYCNHSDYNIISKEINRENKILSKWIIEISNKTPVLW